MCGGFFSPKMFVHTCIEKHTTSLGDNYSIHMLCHTIMLRSVCDGVVLKNVFFATIIIKFI
jgi:hypothetical protein